MFEKFKFSRKIKAFRGKKVTCTAYNADNCSISLKSDWHKAELAFRLVTFDNKLQLAFSGDVISSDGECLARVMRVMWNEPLPSSLVSDELVQQLWENSKHEAHFCDMASYVAGMPNEVVVTVKSVYRIDNE